MSLHNDLHTWAGRARARGEDTIYITLDTVDKIVEALISSPGKDGGQEVEAALQPASGSAGLYDFYAENPDQPASTALVDAASFLAHRLDDFRQKIDDIDDEIEFEGKIVPALDLLRAALSASQSTSTEPTK